MKKCITNTSFVLFAIFLCSTFVICSGAAIDTSSADWRLRFKAYAARHAPELLQTVESESSPFSAESSPFDVRLEIFKANAARVEELQESKMGESAQFSLDESPFSHLTFKEFAQARLPKMGSPERGSSLTSSEPLPTLASKDLPSFDWRTPASGGFSAVTPVKDQGAMGSCWAFSAAGNIEGQRAVASKGANMDDVSVEQLIECDDQTGRRSIDHEMHGDCGVFGGWPYLAYQYWSQAPGGVRSWKEMPYCAGIQYGQPGCCLPCMVKGYNKSLCGDHGDLFCNVSTTLGQRPGGLCHNPPQEGSLAKVKDWRRFPNNSTGIAEALVETGPLSIALDATLAFQFYKGGVLDPSSHPVLGGCSAKEPTELNHAVLLVGYGEDKGKAYWTVKNSWGVKWGESGYFRFVRGEDKCGIESEVTTAILE